MGKDKVHGYIAALSTNRKPYLLAHDPATNVTIVLDTNTHKLFLRGNSQEQCAETAHNLLPFMEDTLEDFNKKK